MRKDVILWELGRKLLRDTGGLIRWLGLVGLRRGKERITQRRRGRGGARRHPAGEMGRWVGEFAVRVSLWVMLRLNRTLKRRGCGTRRLLEADVVRAWGAAGCAPTSMVMVMMNAGLLPAVFAAEGEF